MKSEGGRSAAGTTQDQPALVRECPLCGTFERRLLIQRDAWRIVECTACGMVFIGNVLSYETQIEAHDWLDDYSKELSRRKKRHPFLLFLSQYTRRLRPETNARLLKQTLRWAAGGTLVDFGCGDASFLQRASEKFDVIGIEISPRLAAMSRNRMPAINILEGPVTQIAEQSLPANAFDVVTQFGYIEHEWHPLAGLRAAFRVLKPGGVTLIKTPNYATWNRVVMGEDWCGYHIPAHCNYFTPRSLAKMLSLAGFSPLPRPLLDSLPTSDSLWMAARKPI